MATDLNKKVEGLGLGFRVQGLGFQVWDFQVWDLGFMIWGSRFGVRGLGAQKKMKHEMLSRITIRRTKAMLKPGDIRAISCC